MVSVEILNPQNVYVFTITIEYSDALSFNYPDPIQPGEGQFDINRLAIGNETRSEGGGKRRQLVLGNNTDDVSVGTLFTIKFEASVLGNHRIAIIGEGGHTQLLNSGAQSVQLADSELPSLNVPVRGPLQGTVGLVPSVGAGRVGEISFIDVELKDRSRAHSYEITIDPSENLGSLTVSYNSDDTNGTAITNHNAGDPITIGAYLWLPNDPIDDVID